MKQKIEVASSRPYSIYLGAALEDLGAYLEKELGGSEHLLIVTHPSVKEIYLERLLKGLNAFKCDVLVVPVGEEEKSLERLSILTAEAVACAADRHSVVLALGGGVIGDLAGFFASVYMRGIRFVQIPTTLLAQVDSSIGGKTAVNHPSGKNLLGAFYPPLVVWTDFSTLQTLPWEEVQNGLAETVKHAILGDPDLFSFLETHHREILDRVPEVYEELATRSLQVKVKVVVEDEKEKGQRMLLNLGHSFGHALETEAVYQGISHGQGVSIGIIAATYLAEARGLITSAEVSRILNLVNSLGLPIDIQGKDPEVLLHLMEADKKNQNRHKVLILPDKIGHAIVVRDAHDEEILQAWHKVIK
ncbi:3-dehydroquinate synthase [Desulfitobacterium sp.]|uniref:3-dehydroquinate synthase n=1 Tax=Desulfitobacterium sp. TaxID=49981 RepID=UPI002B1F1F8C|nr:3-dehydroquinate synthase [Desulfitobacterium sp.]MEA4900460.1 3-dehydroquinate synthase [Desulfitobacterium sp.]